MRHPSTLVTLLVTLVVVPMQTMQSLLDRAWWAGVPDLAVSVAVSLVLAAVCIALAAVAALRGAVRRRRRTSSIDAPPSGGVRI